MALSNAKIPPEIPPIIAANANVGKTTVPNSLKEPADNGSRTTVEAIAPAAKPLKNLNTIRFIGVIVLYF